MPPIAGLHDIWAIFCKLIVTNKVFEPRFAAAAAASEPACPAPTTITSYSFRNIFFYNLILVQDCNFEIYILFHVKHYKPIFKPILNVPRETL
jgi:hypothetical protein